MDRDLQALRRAAALEPERGEAWLALGVALARVSREEALDALYRAALLGAEQGDVQAALSGLGAPASPWPDMDGDCQASRRSPLRGPRRGEVVARGGGAPAFAVIDRDGVVLHPTGGRSDGRALGDTDRHPRLAARFRAAHSPAASSRGAVAVAVRPRAGRGMGDGYVLVRLDDGDAPGEQPEQGSYVRPTVDRAGRVHAIRHVLDADLRPLHERPRPPRGVASSDIACVSVAPDLRQAVVWKHYASQVVGLLDREARLVFSCSGADDPGLNRPIFDDRGRLLVFAATGSGPALRALDERGDAVWSVVAHPGERLALGDGGAVYLAARSTLRRVVEGRVVWSAPFDRVLDPLVVDREGVVYASVIRDADKTFRLVAHGPDGSRLWALEGQHKPLAVDALGRLLATRAGGGLVAIA